MRIANSNVDLTSQRMYSSRSQMIMTKGQMLVQTGQGKTPGFDDVLKDAAGDQNISDGGETLFTNYNAGGGYAIRSGDPAYSKISEIENIRMQLMERILNLMQLIYGGAASGRGGSKMQHFMRSLSSQMYAGSYQWMSVSTASYIHVEEEQTAFTAKGYARTEDGREIGFNVNLNMSRKFTEEIHATHMQPVNLIDPLVINVGSEVTEIADQTFTFDLDADGKEEKINMLSPGSGLLAYDRNGDGIINNGSELFGARSGDGFSELAAFDRDGNGWIDENDEIFEKLRVWCRGDDGKDTLMTLKEGDVGAIFLGRADTEFTSQGSDFAVNAKFRASGVFLHESTGDVGTVHQIDFAAHKSRGIEATSVI